MKIIKFGGSVLRGVEGLSKMASIVKDCSSETLIVISAFSNSTQKLVNASLSASQGKLQEAQEILEILIDSFYLILDDVIVNAAKRKNISSMIELGKKEVENYLLGLSITNELTDRTLDAVMSFGEFFSLHIVSHYLREQGISLESIDARQFVITNEEYGNAKPIRSETKEKLYSVLLPAFKRNPIVITQGFVGRSLKGETTTLGKESSNTTATLLASLLYAEEVIIYTNVEGIRTADPKRIPTTKVIPTLTYSQASLLAFEGLKILHSTTIEQLSGTTIPVTICSLYKTDGEKTVVHSNVNSSENSLNNNQLLESNPTQIVVIEHLNVVKLSFMGTDLGNEQILQGLQVLHSEQHGTNETIYCLESNSAEQKYSNFQQSEKLTGVSIVSTNGFDAVSLRKIVRLLSQYELHIFTVQPKVVLAIFNNTTNEDVLQSIHDFVI